MLRRIAGVTLLVVATVGFVRTPASAGGAGSDMSGHVEGVVRALYPAQRLLVLTNGEEFRVTDPRLLEPLKEGMAIRVDYTQSGGTKTVNRIVLPTP
jgi:hypothetical protein